ncbi:MAG: hypothetical protein ACRDCK_01585, partial [Plesiomonas shigelloides]
LMAAGVCKPVLNLGLPDFFIPQGSQDEIRHDLGLDAQGFVRQVREYLAQRATVQK